MKGIVRAIRRKDACKIVSSSHVGEQTQSVQCNYERECSTPYERLHVGEIKSVLLIRARRRSLMLPAESGLQLLRGSCLAILLTAQ